MFDKSLAQPPVATRLRAGEVPASALAKDPPLEALSIEGYVICDCDDLDRAGDWLRCARGPACPNRAYMSTVYRSESVVRENLDRRAWTAGKRILPSRPAALTVPEPLYLHIHRLQAEGFLGRGAAPCGLPDATRDLRRGHGEEPAWREIQRQRDEEGVEGALLPGGPDATGTLFLFLSAAHCIKTLDLVDTVAWTELLWRMGA